jgi:hypothetical protein
MLQNIIDKVEAAINQQVKDKFGLTEEQTQKTSHAFREEIQNFFSNGSFKNPQFIQSALNNVSSLEDSEVVVKLKENLVNALQDKAGLSPEKAAAVRDFSISEFFKTLSSELTDENGNVDFQKILSKFNMQDLEQTAKDLLGNFGGLFGKK